MLLRTHARILEMQTSAQMTLRHARELLLPLREEARRHNAVTRGARYASFFWTQSLVREDSQRTLLFERFMPVDASNS